MRITKYAFEGTPEEFQAAYPLLNADLQDGNLEKSTDLSSTPTVTLSTKVDEAPTELTEAIAEAFLTKRPFNKVQKGVIQGIMDAGDVGITSSKLAGIIGCEPKTIKSTMRWFGKRVAHTPGWPKKKGKSIGIFSQAWEGTENRYRLRVPMRVVLESGRVKL
jgi:hypothetical protein